MKPEELKEGTYKLAHDVVNPEADRRCRGDFDKIPVWPAGTVIIVTKHTESLEEGKNFHYYTVKPTSREFRYSRIHRAHGGYVALIEALEPCEETIGALFTRLDVYTSNNERFLRWLLEEGHIGKTLFRLLYSEWQEGGVLETSTLFKHEDE